MVTAGRANLSTYAEISKSEASIEKRLLNLVGSAPKYSGNPEKVFKWYENLKTHFFNHKWKTIPNKAVKRCCCPGISKTVLLHPAGLAFENCETGEFFT